MYKTRVVDLSIGLKMTQKQMFYEKILLVMNVWIYPEALIVLIFSQVLRAIILIITNIETLDYIVSTLICLFK